MSTFEDVSFSVDEFSGTARLFPLPNLVLFPHVMQPLHVFEPRYRAMLEEALANDKLIAMGVLASGWEKDYDGRPPVWSTACLSRVVLWRRLDSGAYNILLMAISRVRLVRELPPCQSFREAVVEIRQDRYPADQADSTATLQSRLRDAFLRILPDLPLAGDQIDQILSRDISLGALTDIISYMLDIELEAKEVLLAETDVHRRAQLLLEHMAQVAWTPEPVGVGPTLFPPRFSCN